MLLLLEVDLELLVALALRHLVPLEHLRLARLELQQPVPLEPPLLLVPLAHLLLPQVVSLELQLLHPLVLQLQQQVPLGLHPHLLEHRRQRPVDSLVPSLLLLVVCLVVQRLLRQPVVCLVVPQRLQEPLELRQVS